MNPKISITVDSKNKAVATITGMATVGAEIDVEVNGLTASDIESYAATDVFVGKSLRFRIVDPMGKDLVRFPLIERTSSSTSDGDQWQVTTVESADVFKTYDGTSLKGVDFNTDLLRKAFCGVPFNETMEFGIILDSIVDKTQYATGKIKIKQWAAASTEDPTVLPDWRETLAQLEEDLASVEASKTAAAASATSAASSASSASTSASSASGSATLALGYQNAAGQYATTASNAKTAAETAQTAAETAASHYPKINTTTNKWQVWDVTTSAYVDTTVNATGDDGISPHIDSTTGNWFIGTTDTGVHAKGDTGAGVPTGGTAGQFLIKKSGTDYDVEWKSQEGMSLDSTVTQSSANGVKSSGIWSFVKGLLPSWLTSSYAEPATVASVTAKYTKPSDGIPKADLASGVQTSLGLADTALQSHQDISGKADKATTLSGYGITDAKIENGVITLGANTITPLTSHQDISGKQDKVYTLGASFTPDEVTLTNTSSEELTLSVEYSNLTLSNGNWSCTAYFEGSSVSEELTFSTSDGGHTESDTSIDFGSQSVSIVVDEETYSGTIRIQATRTRAYCGAEADQTPTEDSNKLVTSGGVYDVVSDKATKVASATSGNIATLDANGDLADSGKSLADKANSYIPTSTTTEDSGTLNGEECEYDSGYWGATIGSIQIWIQGSPLFIPSLNSLPMIIGSDEITLTRTGSTGHVFVGTHSGTTYTFIFIPSGTVITGDPNPQIADKAMKDGDGNKISDTYVKNSGGTMTGTLTINGTDYTSSYIKKNNLVYEYPVSDGTFAITSNITADKTHAVSASVNSGALKANVNTTTGDIDVSPLFSSTNTSNNLDNIRVSASDSTSAATLIGQKAATTDLPYGYVSIEHTGSAITAQDGKINRIYSTGYTYLTSNLSVSLPVPASGKITDLILRFNTGTTAYSPTISLASGTATSFSISGDTVEASGSYEMMCNVVPTATSGTYEVITTTRKLS